MVSTSTVTGMPGLARDGGGVRHGRGIVPVDVQQAGAGDLFGRDLIRVDAEAIRPAPQHGALAGGLVDEDVGALVRAVAALLHVVEIDAGGEQALHLDAAALVVADRADVLGPQAESGAGDHGARDLPAGAENLLRERHLAGIGGKVRKEQQGIGGVQSHADHVEFGHRFQRNRSVIGRRSRLLTFLTHRVKMKGEERAKFERAIESPAGPAPADRTSA